MERLNLIRQVSSDSYKLLTVARNHALYSEENGRYTLGYGGRTQSIPFDELTGHASARARSSDASSVVRDLLLDSLGPLTAVGESIAPSAPVFLGCFTPTADWLTVPPGVNPTWKDPESPIGASPAAVFLRQRYPGLRFEVYLDLPTYRLEPLLKEAKPTLTSIWRAYSSDPLVGTSGPLVAYGRAVDVLDVSYIYPRIASRQFIVEQIISPAFFKPTILPLLGKRSEDPVATSSNTANTSGPVHGLKARIKALLRESQSLMSTLLGVSALLASINPMLGILIHTTSLGNILQLVFASVGSLCALLGMVIMLLNKIVSVLDEGVAGAIGSLAGAVPLMGGEDEEVKVSEQELVDGSVFRAGERMNAEAEEAVFAGLQAGWSKLSSTESYRTLVGSSSTSSTLAEDDGKTAS